MIKLYWRDAEKRVLVREMADTWTWDEYYASIEEMKSILCTVDYPVIVLVDSRKITHSSAVPDHALQNISEANKHLPKNLLAQIIVSESRWLEMMSAILRHLMPKEAHKYIFMRSMDKAEKHIEKLSRSKRSVISVRQRE